MTPVCLRDSLHPCSACQPTCRLPNFVRESVRLAEAPSFEEPITAYALDSSGAATSLRPISHPPSRRPPDKYALHAPTRVGRGSRPVSRFVPVGVQRTDLRREPFSGPYR